MADFTAIEWTDATWNPVTGCTKISAGCDHCYAERFAERFRGVKDHPFERGFDLTLRPKRLSQPMAWRRPRMIFVNSMSDLFHKAVPRAFVDAVFETMESADWHVFQILTKRSSRLRAYVNARYADRPAPAHIWMGVSVEDGTKLSRVRHLGDTAARVRFLSLEAPYRAGRSTRSQRHPLDHRGRRERSRGTADASRLGPPNQESLHGSQGPVLLQAMGRPYSQGRRPVTGRPRVEPVAEHAEYIFL